MGRKGIADFLLTAVVLRVFPRTRAWAHPAFNSPVFSLTPPHLPAPQVDPLDAEIGLAENLIAAPCCAARLPESRLPEDAVDTLWMAVEGGSLSGRLHPIVIANIRSGIRAFLQRQERDRELHRWLRKMAWDLCALKW